MNDQKISAIGQYIRHTLVTKISNTACRVSAAIQEIEPIFGWEIAHRSDD